MTVFKHMGKAMARLWARPAGKVNVLEAARRREHGLTSADLYPPPKSFFSGQPGRPETDKPATGRNSRNSEEKD